MRIIVTIIPTDLVPNPILSSFRLFLQIKNKNQVLSKLVVWQQETFLLFVYSTPRSTLKPVQIQYTFIKEFPDM